MPEDAKAQLTRKPELDGVRGLAILMVIALHYLSMTLSTSGVGWAVALGKSMRLFWSGVDLFFVLSGYLIGSILLQNRDALNYYSVFFIRRACRIWPLYYFVLALFLFTAWYGRGQEGFVALSLGPIPLWSYFVFLQNVFMAVHHTFGSDWLTVTWSLAVEEQFYLVLPLMVRLLPGRRLVYTAIAGIIIAVLLRMWFSREFLVFVTFITRADSVLCGLLLAIGMKSVKVRAIMEEHLNLIMMLTGLFALGMVILTLNERLIGEMLHLWAAIFYTGVITLVTMRRPRWLYRCLTFRWLQVTGIISYGLYLFHSPAAWLVQLWLIESGIKTNQPNGTFIAAALAFILTLLASLATHYLFERSFIRLGHRLCYRFN